jgi:hypothetical protein
LFKKRPPKPPRAKPDKKDKKDKKGKKGKKGKKKQKKKFIKNRYGRHIKLEIGDSPEKDAYHLDDEYKSLTGGKGKKNRVSEDRT